jgi:hypothetical protein
VLAEGTAAARAGAQGAPPLSPTLVPAIVALWRESGEQHWIRTQGTSMLPLIGEADLLLVSYNLASVRRGSIVVFWQRGRLIAHRVLRVLPGGAPGAGAPLGPRFVTKGDHAWAVDAPICADDLLGHVLTIQRRDRVIALDRPQWQVLGWLIAAASLTVAVLYGWLRGAKGRLLRTYREKRK